MHQRTNSWDELYEVRDFPVFSDILLSRLFEKYQFAGEALDIGCGTGDLAARLSKRNLKVTGIDLSRVAIDKAKLRAPELKFRAGDVYDIDGQYDLISAKLVYALIKDKPRFINKVTGLLAPGGHFVVSTPIRAAGYEYDPHYTNISADDGDIKLLKDNFETCELFDTSYRGLAEAEQVWVCS